MTEEKRLEDFLRPRPPVEIPGPRPKWVKVMKDGTQEIGPLDVGPDDYTPDWEVGSE